jgi:hypothetical protein
MHNLLAYQICKLAIIEVTDSWGEAFTLDKLPPPIIAEISTEILELSTLTEEDTKSLDMAVDLTFDKRFKTGSWKCDTCQYKKLDKTRNCGYLAPKFQGNDFSVTVGKQVYKECPIYFLDTTLFNDALDCYMMYDKNFLPDSGGLYDQTKFFVYSSKLISNKVKELEEKAMKEHNKGT